MPGVEDRFGCCSMFDARRARSDARGYRKKGLDGPARRLVDALRAHGVEGATLLEIGGGIGSIEIEMLGSGVSAATNVELSTAYEAEAATLLAERGLEDRVNRRILDFAASPSAIPAADLVVLHKVICCYPDMPGLVGPAADHAGRLLALTFPRETWWMKLGIGTVNAFQRLRRHRFRIYSHPHTEILAAAEARGLRTTFDRTGPIWRSVILERTHASA